MAGVDAANPPLLPPPSSHGSGGGVKVEALKHIDINQLSQSELQALSLCSDSAFHVRRTDDVLSPNLDRSLFNESAGSRRQTYSRLHHRSHSRLPGFHPSLKPHRPSHSSSDPVSHSIVHFLKHFLDGNHNPPPPPPLPPSPQDGPGPTTELGFTELDEKLKIERKRMRESRNLNQNKLLENGVGIELQRMNGKGEVVDFAELERKGDELYSEELKRRTVGLETEDGVLGFLWGLEGQWCSRRKKRKYVDAGLLGDALPVGWKLLLGLRRRDCRVSVYCRRYISPSGQQYTSCKEVASFLKSYFGGNDADQQRDQKACSFPSETNACPADNKGDLVHDIATLSTFAGDSSIPNETVDCLMGIENLPEVQVKDIFECFKCKLTFDEKNVYLQHLFSFHQNTTKRYKFGAPVGEGVIIKDGKYECQFCHKVFEERRSYNGHVGVHVRNSGKISVDPATSVSVHKTADSLMEEASPSRSLKMDALIKIAQNSIFETSDVGTVEQAIASHSGGALSSEEAKVVKSDCEADLSSNPVEIQKGSVDSDRAPGKDLNLWRPAIAGKSNMVENSDVVKNNDIATNGYSLNLNIETAASCITDSQHAGSSQIEKYGNSSLGMDYGCLKRSDDDIEDTPALTVEDIGFQDSSVPLVQSFQFFPSFDSVSNKEEHEFSIVDPKLQHVREFEELRFDDIDPFNGFVNGQEFQTLPGGSVNLGNDSGLEDGFNSTVGFGSEEVMLNTLDGGQLTVCVWCRTEFKLEGIESETPSDSIGYMCPTCKAKISGHFDGCL